jgi:hypothetical protein
MFGIAAILFPPLNYLNHFIIIVLILLRPSIARQSWGGEQSFSSIGGVW